MNAYTLKSDVVADVSFVKGPLLKERVASETEFVSSSCDTPHCRPFKGLECGRCKEKG